MSRVRRGIAFATSMLDPGVWFHALRILHYYGYAHVPRAPQAHRRSRCAHRAERVDHQR